MENMIITTKRVYNLALEFAAAILEAHGYELSYSRYEQFYQEPIKYAITTGKMAHTVVCDLSLDEVISWIDEEFYMENTDWYSPKSNDITGRPEHKCRIVT